MNECVESIIVNGTYSFLVELVCVQRRSLRDVYVYEVVKGAVDFGNEKTSRLRGIIFINFTCKTVRRKTRCRVVCPRDNIEIRMTLLLRRSS